MNRIICTVTNDLNFDQRMIRICTSLAKAGYDVTLVGRQTKSSPQTISQPFRQVRFRLFFQKGKLFYLEYNARLFLFLLFAKFDLICSIDLDSLLPGFLASKIRNKQIVFDAHEYFTEVPEVVGRPMVQRIWNMVANYCIPKIKYAYTVGDSLAEIFSGLYGIPFGVIRNVPITKEEPAKKRPEDSSMILIYQGVLNEGRGLEEAILAIKEMNGVTLWLAGEGDLSSELRQLTKNEGLGARVIFYGRVSPSELHDLTTKAHVGLNLLENKGLSYYYSLANKSFDYMQAGIPSLCMSFPEYEKINKEYDTFELIDTLAVPAIKVAIKRLFDHSYYQEKCRKNRRAAQHFIWENEEKKLVSFYRQILPPH